MINQHFRISVELRSHLEGDITLIICRGICWAMSKESGSTLGEVVQESRLLEFSRLSISSPVPWTSWKTTAKTQSRRTQHVRIYGKYMRHIWVCLKMLCTPLYPMVLLIIIPTKWLFHWGYTPFSDKPIWDIWVPIWQPTCPVPRL